MTSFETFITNQKVGLYFQQYRCVVKIIIQCSELFKNELQCTYAMGETVSDPVDLTVIN